MCRDNLLISIARRIASLNDLSLLDCEDELLNARGAIKIANFLEASSAVGRPLRSVAGRRIDHHRARCRAHSRGKAAIEALWLLSAPAPPHGGIQALRNFADVNEFVAAVYASPEYISTLSTSTPISAHVAVDFELQGCPINKTQLLEVISAFLAGRKPAIAAHSVCIECKQRGTVCVMVQGTPCLGPVTHAGCGAICPSYRRGCYGCYGPMETPNTAALAREWRALGAVPRDIQRAFRTFNAMAEPFFKEAQPMATRTIRVDYLARVEGEGALDLHISDGRVVAAGSVFSSRRASSRRSCAAAATWKLRTSWPGSAASVRSPIR